MAKHRKSHPGGYGPKTKNPVMPETAAVPESVEPKAASPDFIDRFRTKYPVSREDVVDDELAFIGWVRRYRELGCDLMTHGVFNFIVEMAARSPEDKAAGRLAPLSLDTFERLLRDKAEIAGSPRLLNGFRDQYRLQPKARRTRWKNKFFARWEPEPDRRGQLALIVMVLFDQRRSRGMSAKMATGEIQRMHDRLVDGDALSTEESKLKPLVICGARVESLLDEARGVWGRRTKPKRPRTRKPTKRIRGENA